MGCTEGAHNTTEQSSRRISSQIVSTRMLMSIGSSCHISTTSVFKTNCKEKDTPCSHTSMMPLATTSFRFCNGTVRIKVDEDLLMFRSIQSHHLSDACSSISAQESSNDTGSLDIKTITYEATWITLCELYTALKNIQLEGRGLNKSVAHYHTSLCYTVREHNKFVCVSKTCRRNSSIACFWFALIG